MDLASVDLGISLRAAAMPMHQNPSATQRSNDARSSGNTPPSGDDSMMMRRFVSMEMQWSTARVLSRNIAMKRPRCSSGFSSMNQSSRPRRLGSLFFLSTTTNFPTNIPALQIQTSLRASQPYKYKIPDKHPSPTNTNFPANIPAPQIQTSLQTSQPYKYKIPDKHPSPTNTNFPTNTPALQLQTSLQTPQPHKYKLPYKHPSPTNTNFPTNIPALQMQTSLQTSQPHNYKLPYKLSRPTNTNSPTNFPIPQLQTPPTNSPNKLSQQTLQTNFQTNPPNKLPQQTQPYKHTHTTHATTHKRAQRKVQATNPTHHNTDRDYGRAVDGPTAANKHTHDAVATTHTQHANTPVASTTSQRRKDAQTRRTKITEFRCQNRHPQRGNGLVTPTRRETSPRRTESDAIWRHGILAPCPTDATPKRARPMTETD